MSRLQTAQQALKIQAVADTIHNQNQLLQQAVAQATADVAMRTQIHIVHRQAQADLLVQTVTKTN